MTLTFEPDLENVKETSTANIYLKHHLVQKLLPKHTQTHTHRIDCYTWTTEVVGNKCGKSTKSASP